MTLHGFAFPRFGPLASAVTNRVGINQAVAASIRALDSVDSRQSLQREQLALAFGGLLSRIAAARGKQGIEFFTPDSVVRTVVELTAPRPDDRIHDPACGSGDLLVGAVRHATRYSGSPESLVVSGQGLEVESWGLARMNLAIHGASADLGSRPALALREDLHSGERFDVIITNPPFNLRRWSGDVPADDPRWRYGPPPEQNANFAWLQHVVSSLAEGGRAAVLMANAAASSEQPQERAIRERMVEDGVVEGLVALPPQLFYGTQVPVTLWLLRPPIGAPDRLLFVDATEAGTVVDRNHRILSDSDIGQLIDAVSKWRTRR
jgi:type I restriction enzyme M protein